MNTRISLPRGVFMVANYVILTSLALFCVIPFIHTLAVSLSDKISTVGGNVGLWPVGANLQSYKQLLAQADLSWSLLTTLERLALGMVINFLFTVMIAYPLSKENKDLKFRTFYVWFFVLTMLIGGGLIPWYLTVKNLRLVNTIWALVLPCAVPIFNVVLLLNFFRSLPKELEEAALVDGARQFTVMWKIYIPISLPGLATVTLFSFLMHWNSWFDGFIFESNSKNYPLQTYLLQFVLSNNPSITNPETMHIATLSAAVQAQISPQSVRAALLIIGIIPILMFFPLFQRYLKTGLVFGSVKG